MTVSTHFIGSATGRRRGAVTGAEHQGRTRAGSRVTRPRVAEGIQGLQTDAHGPHAERNGGVLPAGASLPVTCAGVANAASDQPLRELVIFWRLPNGTRCVVVQPTPHTWQLRIVRDNDAPILIEDFSDAGALYLRAQALRAIFATRDIAS